MSASWVYPVILGAGMASLATICVIAYVPVLLEARRRRLDEQAAQAAADHDEPPRDFFEGVMRAAEPTPIFDEVAAQDEHEWVRIEMAVADFRRELGGLT